MSLVIVTVCYVESSYFFLFQKTFDIMDGKSDEKYLKRCFDKIISLIHETIDQLRPKQSQSPSDVFHTNSMLSTGVYTFTINKFEEEQLETLRENIQHHIDQCRTRLSSICKRYLFEFLNEFHYDENEQKFSNSFTMDSLYPFECSLRGALASIDAFAASWGGELTPVKDFIQNYPTFKDKPGLHGTTLLYSSARNNHLKLVQYLVQNAHCAVNAQNLQELEKALHTTTKGGKFASNPSAASTALHGACYNGDLEITAYLIEHGADYFIQNQARETPIENGLSKDYIRRFFEDFLILGYSQKPQTLPVEPLDKKENSGIFDCIWQYKSLSSRTWESFSANESTELNQSLLVGSGDEIKQDIYLNDGSFVYNVSLSQFLRSSKSHDGKNKLSWVRCRGSSVWNYHVSSLWQIMIIEHISSQTINEPSLKVFDIPRINDSRFKLQLNSWYNCVPHIATEFDKAINYRRKRLVIDVDFISDELLTFDLQAFSFTNAKQTISGCIRWIPKFQQKGARRSIKKPSFGRLLTSSSNSASESPDSKSHEQKSERNINRSVFDGNDDDDDDLEYDENEDDIQPSTRLNADDDDNDVDDSHDRKEVNLLSI